MSEFEGMNTSAASTETDSSEKIRGRIPKSAWGYVRGQYEIAGLTYEEIGQEFNCTPSAVFYVVKQATLREIAPTLERPEPSLSETANNAAAVRDHQWATRKVREVTAPAPAKPSQVELMAQQAQSLLEDETCKRLFDAASKVIMEFTAMRAGPDDTAKKQAKEALHELRRAAASVELKIETTPNASSPTSVRPVRAPELA